MLSRLSHRFFRLHPGQLLLAMIGIAAGIAVVTGVALLRGALMDSLDAAASRLAGEQSISIRAETGALSIQDYAELSRLPGAPDWVPVLRIPVRVDGVRFEVLALDPFVGNPDSRLLLGPGSVLATAVDVTAPPAAIVGARTLDAMNLDVDATLQLVFDGQTFPVAIAAVLASDQDLDRRLLMDIAQAQDLFGMRGQVSELLAPATAQEWLEDHLPDGLVWQSASDRRDSAAGLTAGMRANLTAMSLLALATGLFVVYSVLNFLIVQRRQSFGMLRALGMTHPRLAQLLIGESLTLAALGGLIGLVAGTWLADRLLGLVAVPVGELYGQLPLVQSAPSWGLYAMIWLLGLFAALLVTLPLLREAMRVPPGRLVRTVYEPGLSLKHAGAYAAWPMLAGVVLVLTFDSLAAALIGLFLFLTGLVMMIPALGFGLLNKLGQRLPRNLAGRALVLLQSSRSRLAPALAALTLALALAIGMAMMILGFRVAVDDWVERLLRADVYVSADQGELDGEKIQAVVSRPGVEVWSSVRQRRLADGRLITAYDLPAQAWSGFDWIAGKPSRDAFEAGREALVTEPFARNRALVPGDRLEVATPAGTQSLTIGAVFRDYSSDQGLIAINGAQYREWFDDPVRDSIGLYLTSDTGRWLEQLSQTALAERLSWITPLEIRQQSLAVFDRTFRISWALAVLVGLIALIALTSALLALGLERAREYATLRALGLSPKGLIGLVMLQTGGLTVLALVLCLPLALLMDMVLSAVIQPRAFGWSVPFGWPPLAPLLWTAPLAVIAGVLAGIYPALRIARRPLIEHLRAD